MSDVLDYVREKDPRFKDVSDQDLALYLGSKKPEFLNDPEFKSEYQSASVDKGMQVAGAGVTAVLKTLTNPAAGAAAEAGRADAEFQRAVQPEQPPQDSLQRAARDFQAAPYATGESRNVGLTDPFIPIPRMDAKNPVLQKTLTEEFGRPPTETEAAAAAAIVNQAKGFAEFAESPIGLLTAGFGVLGKVAQKLIALGFAGGMAKDVPKSAREAGKASVTGTQQEKFEAYLSLGQNVLLPGILAKSIKGLGTELRKTAPNTANALHEQTKEVLQPLQSQPGESTREVPAKGTGAEAGARSEPALPQKTQAVLDWERYTELAGSMRGKTLDEAMGIAKQLEEIKNRHGGMPPPKPELITHAAFIDDKGETHLGANHPEILERLGVEGMEERESRNTDRFGFWTTRGRFISREEAGPVATQAGQNLETFEPNEQVHSDQIASPVEPGETLGDAAPQVPPGEPPVIQAGAAHITEIPETGAGGEKYGIAQRVREERAQAGQVDPVEPGRGISMPDSIERGRQINAADPAAPERLLQAFESDPERKFSADLIASVRAHGESLARGARRVEQEFGTASPEYRAARDMLSAWDKRTKPIQTEWSKAGQAQQSWTDLDTGSIAGLERERRRLTDKDFTPAEEEQAGKLAKDVRDTEAAADEAAKAVNEELQNNASPETQLENERNQLAEATARANTEADNVAKTQERVDATRKALDAAYQTVREAAVGKAKAENKARVAQAQRDVKTAEIQADAARKALEAAEKVVRERAAQVAKTDRVVKERKALDDQAVAAQRAIDAANKTVREAAAARAEAENKARVASAAADKKVASIQAKAAAQAEKAAWKTVREAAARAAEIQRKILADPAIPVWEKARQYLDKHIVSFDDLRAKIASDLGLPVEKVTQLLARTKRMKFLTDDLWLKRQRERNAKVKAQLWVQGLDVPGYEKFVRGLPRALFALRVGFHGTVALGTHAPAVAFQPHLWGTYVRNFGRMYGYVLKPSFYEGQMQGLIRRQNYATALRAGLVVDPFKFEDFKHPGITTEAAEKIKAAMSKATGLDPNFFSKMGERGYSVLKVLRQDLFDHHWDNLPRQLQTTEMAEAIADAVNHITGVVKTPAPFKAELVAFAPKLQMSRAAFLFGDPIRAGVTGVRAAVRSVSSATGIGPMPEVTPAEVWFAKNELKSKGLILGTLGSLLALNQGMLLASGSKQRVNITDPFKNDFGKFKVAGLNVSYGNPLITMARLPLRVGTLAVGPGGKLRKLVYPDEDAARMVWEYFRSQLSPFAALAADLIFREDWQKRQLWFSEHPQPKRLLAQGTEPYTAGEYWAQQALPIPAQELVRESLKEGFGPKPIASTLFMALTGGRVSEDYDHPQ